MRTSKAVANRMVDLLFTDARTLRFDSILYPVCPDGVVVDAVYRYVEQNQLDPPNGVAVTSNNETAQRLREAYGNRDLTVVESTILAEDPGVERTFDFVVANPPSIGWQSLSAERRREFAASLRHVSPDDGSVVPAVMYIDRALQFLRPDGRGVFLTAPELTTQRTASAAQQYVAPFVNDLVELPTEADGAGTDSRVLTVVTGEGEGEYEPDRRVNEPEPEQVESSLVAAAHNDTQRRVAEAVMTPAAELDVVAANRDVASVYLDLFAKDYDTTLVYEDPDRRAGLHGFVSRAELTVEDGATVATATEPIPTMRCVALDAGLDTVVSKLGQQRFCFVGEPTGPHGLITRYDLNKLPVYHQLYDQFARFEIGLRQFIRQVAPGWDERTDVTLGVYGANDLVADELATAQLRDLVSIVTELELTSELGIPISEYRASLQDLVSLRNGVAHYNPVVHVMSSRPTADDPERGAPQLATEYELLTSCVDTLT
ncbi:DNA methyltransferase family protein [Halobellus clavatus]|nr:type I restriction-modification system subunit M [Halobellus clavatus]